MNLEVIFKLCVIFCIFVQAKSMPLQTGTCDQIHGVPVMDKLEDEYHYGEPEYIIPLLEVNENLAYPSSEEDGNCNLVKHIGYLNVNDIDHRLIPLDDYLDKHCLPENVELKIMEDAVPVFAPEDLPLSDEEKILELKP